MYLGNDEEQDVYQARLNSLTELHADGRGGEVDSAELRMLKKKMLDKLKKEEEQGQEQEHELEEDSLVVLAKKMGSAGKHLWKRMVTQKADKEDVSSPNDQRTAPSEETTLLPPSEKVEQEVNDLEEKTPVWKRNKLRFRNPLTPTVSTQ